MGIFLSQSPQNVSPDENLLQPTKCTYVNFKAQKFEKKSNSQFCKKNNEGKTQGFFSRARCPKSVLDLQVAAIDRNF